MPGQRRRSSSSRIASTCGGVRGVVDGDPPGPDARRLRSRRAARPARPASPETTTDGRAVDRGDATRRPAAAVEPAPRPRRRRQRDRGHRRRCRPAPAAPGCAAPRPGPRPPGTARRPRRRRRSRPASGRPRRPARRRSERHSAASDTITANSAGWTTSTRSSARRAGRLPQHVHAGDQSTYGRSAASHSPAAPRRPATRRAAPRPMPAHCEPCPGKTKTRPAVGAGRAR